ncbi:alcohol dehydrogenase catalytic domain-containing protein [Streptomyces sp. cf386]|uniref:alcohol dehydrogenase catalytic domain-containing protein n=1 Tax=Streptomyces sp. cf386 TaxID=1761904 RepID=UPI00352451E7
MGWYPVPPGASPYPGLEVSGRISAIGAGVTQWQPGDEVCALLAGGKGGRVRAEGRRPCRAAAQGAQGHQSCGSGGPARSRRHGMVERLHDRCSEGG